MDNSRDKLDRLIDGALASYSDAEPLAGLEERVLNRARVAETGHRRVFGWVVALGLAASLAVVWIVIRGERRLVPRSQVAVVHVGPRVTAQRPPDVPKPTARRVARRSSRPKLLPKLEQFPAPTPLTEEERALVALVQRDPDEVREIFGDLQKQIDEPIEIQPIRIAPLQNDGAP